MVTVVSFHTGAHAALTDVDLAGFLEDKIAQVVGYAVVPTTGVAAALVMDANGRMSPLPAGTTVAVGHIRLVDWQTINPGSAHLAPNAIQLTVLYLKDAAGVFP